MSKILYESKKDGIIITKKTKYWLYILTDIQWDIINNNLKSNNMYISAYSKRNIGKNDIILFYIKRKKGYNGFIGIGQTETDMTENTDNVVVYRDNNLNRYIIKLSSITLHNDIQRLSNFNDIIVESDIGIKSSTHFAMKYLRGECIFKEIPKQVGIVLTKDLLTSVIRG